MTKPAAGKAVNKGLDLAVDIGVTGAIAVTSVIIGGTFLDLVEPYTRSIPVLGNVVTSIRAAWRKVYNP